MLEIIRFQKEFNRKHDDYWYAFRIAVDEKVVDEFRIPASDVSRFRDEAELHRFLERTGRGMLQMNGDARSLAVA